MAKIVLVLLLSSMAFTVAAQEVPKGGTLRIESGLQSSAYNSLQYPDNRDGTRFSLRGPLGADAQGFFRLTYEVPYGDGAHGLRFVVADLQDAGTGTLPYPVKYRGKTFAAGVPTHAYYQFDGYRATYWWRIGRDPKGEYRVGFTLNERDAAVRLEQAGVRDSITNEGPVPLLYLAVDHRIGKRLVLSGETDAFAVPGGRAIDLNARLAYTLTPKVDLLLGARALDGFTGDTGADASSLRNSIRYYYATAGLGFRF